MPNFICLQASGLKGLVRAEKNLDVKVLGPTMPMSVGFSFIQAKKDVECLFLACHGKESFGYNEASNAKMRGGFGLTIGSEDITHENVAQWAAIKGICKNIIVYSCAAADTAPGQAGKWGDGKYLIGALAIHTECTVYAADEIQFYDLRRGAYIDFGDWEGQLWRFKSDGTPPATVSEAPYEMRDLRSTVEKITDALL